MNQIIERGFPAMKPINPVGRNANPGTPSSLKKARSPRTHANTQEAKIGVSDLTVMTSKQVEQQSWSTVLDKVGKLPGVVVQGDQRKEAVILSVAMYELLLRHVGEIPPKEIANAIASARVQAEWDARLAVLNEGDSLAEVIKNAPHQGKVKLGPAF
ncbi:hypothetical protein [Stenotrophomonas sp.]|uniref:hypothetical protein n=1 Tax=Stenotrophomonas sp. TaxID=69392 RepID=UPI00289C85A1|nr:hypothetical protein [Stenotrophomonas sp.]